MTKKGSRENAANIQLLQDTPKNSENSFQTEVLLLDNWSDQLENEKTHSSSFPSINYTHFRWIFEPFLAICSPLKFSKTTDDSFMKF